MDKGKKKYIDVDVIAFLEEIMKGNTKYYQSDFEIDKEMIFKCAKSHRKEDKTLLWLSRLMGTQCNKEQDVFVKESAGHSTWLYYGEQGYDNNSIVACAIEITGARNDVVCGNVFVLDYDELVADIKGRAVAPLAYEKTFEDGFCMRVPIQQSSAGFYHRLIEQHGGIVDSLMIPQNEDELSMVLSGQKRKREKLKLGRSDGFKLGLDAQIKGSALNKCQAEKKVTPKKEASLEHDI